MSKRKLRGVQVLAKGEDLISCSVIFVLNEMERVNFDKRLARRASSRTSMRNPPKQLVVLYSSIQVLAWWEDHLQGLVRLGFFQGANCFAV